MTARLLGTRAGGCTEACSEMHTFSWPCEQSVLPPRPNAFVRFWRRHRYYWRCRHCGSPVFNFRVDRQSHWAHRYGEAHCEAPCPRTHRCRCSFSCEWCDAPLPSKDATRCPSCGEAILT